MGEKYIYNKTDNCLLIMDDSQNSYGAHEAIVKFCKDYQILLEEFNIPIIIDKTVKSCAYLLKNCTNFNQKVEIPQGVIKCQGMFYNCKKFNQEVRIPEGVKTCSSMFYNCETFNQSVYLPDSLQDCEEMFYNCKLFNQKVFIPDQVDNCMAMFMGCEAFNEKVIMSQNTKNTVSMFRDCKSFNQKIDIPEKATLCSSMFEGCSQFNQPVSVGESVTHGDFIFKDCAKLNQLVEIYSTSCSCTDMLKGCDSLETRNVIVHCKRIRPLTLKAKLQDIWGTEKVKEGTNIVYDRAKKKKAANIENIEYRLVDNEKISISKEAIQKLTVSDILGELQRLSEQEKMETLEISEHSDNSMKVLTIEFEYPLFAIAIIDEWKDVIYYYNSGEGKREELEIGGNIYPKYMVSENKEVLYKIIDDFLNTGRPSKQVKWKKQ